MREYAPPGTRLLLASSFVSTVPMGYLLVAGTLLPVPSYLVFAATTEPAWLIAASVLGGVGLASGAAGALAVSSFDALLAEKASDDDRSRGARDRCGLRLRRLGLHEPSALGSLGGDGSS
jgi:hypothetical protein